MSAGQKPNLETPAKHQQGTWLDLTDGPPFQCQSVLSLKIQLSFYKFFILASVEFSFLSCLLPLAMPEEQWVVIEAAGVSPPEEN